MTPFDLPWITLNLTHVFWHLLGNELGQGIIPTTVTASLIELPWGQLKMTSFDLPWVTLNLTHVFWHLLGTELEKGIIPITVTASPIELPWGQLKMTSFDLPWVTLNLTHVFWHLLGHKIYFPGLSQKCLAWSSSSCDFVTYRVAFRQLTYSDWKTSPWPECATHVHIKKWLLLLCNWAFWLICWSFTQFGIQHKKITPKETGPSATTTIVVGTW